MVDIPIWEWPRAHRATINSTFRLMPMSLSAQSPYTGEQTIYGPTAQRFQAKLTFPGKRSPDWRYLSGFITRLRGMSGRLRMVDYNRMRCAFDVALLRTPPAAEPWADDQYWSDGRGWESGFLPPFVVAAENRSAGNRNLLLKSFPVSTAGVMQFGDLFEHRPGGIATKHGSLYEVTGNFRTNAAGQTRVYFEAGLRRDVFAGDMIVIRYPTSVFSLTGDAEGEISRGLANVGNMGMSLVEVMPQEVPV